MSQKHNRHHRLRTLPLFGQRPRVDRENLVIHDAVAMLANVEALGHEMWADLKTLTITAALGNRHRAGFGVQGRFGHPGMSENSAGRKFMKSKNFRVEGGKLLHDIELMPEASGSPAFGGADVNQYVMDMAEGQPEEIAESFVLDTELVWTLDDGREFDVYDNLSMTEAGVERDPDDGRPLRALTPYPVMRPVSLFYLDIVNEGALTHDGLFSADTTRALLDGTSGVFAQQIFEAVDELRAEYNIPLADIPRKANQIVSAYLQAREWEMAGTSKKLQTVLDKESTLIKPALAALAAEPPPEPDGEPEESDSEVEDLDTLVDEAEADATEAEQAEPVEAAPENEQFARLALLEASVEKLTRIVKAQQRTLKAQAARIKDLESEPNVTYSLGRGGSRVSGTRQRSLQGRGTPPAEVQRQQPGKVSGRSESPRKQSRSEDEEALQSLRVQQRRG